MPTAEHMDTQPPMEVFHELLAATGPAETGRNFTFVGIPEPRQLGKMSGLKYFQSP